MNRSEVVAKWDALKPRERDAWVAEVVFGADVIGGNVEIVPDGFRPVPKYTADISAAWAVVEAFGDIDVGRYVTVAGNSRYVCRIGCVMVRWLATSDADTAPEAICKAAIIANLCPQEYE